MDKDELISNAKNSVGPGMSLGKADENSLKTSSEFVYRVTGMDQIMDIIECGYVRPKGYGSRSERVGNKVYWSQGGNGLHYIDKRPVISASISDVKDGQIGAIPITDLSAIWMYDKEKDVYVNRLKEILNIYYDKLKETMEIENTNKVIK